VVGRSVDRPPEASAFSSIYSSLTRIAGMTESSPHEAPVEPRDPGPATIDSLVDGGAAVSSTLLLAVAQVATFGAACGALAGFTLLFTLIVVTPGAPIAGAIPAGVLFGGTFGAACGALLAPALGFMLFRDIPLWRLYGYSTIGTVLGGLLAALVGSGPVVGAFAGLAAGLALLRLRTRFG
jgi:hypothetical protein